MKYLFILLVLFTFSLQMTAQDTTILFINNKKAAQAVINPEKTEALLIVKKTALKNIKSFIIKVSGEYIDIEVYKRSLEISGEKSIIIDEIKNKHGYFNILRSGTAKNLLAGKTISLYLLLNPSNPLMGMPSRRMFLGNVVMK